MLRLLNKTRFRNFSVTFSECSFIPGIWVEISFFHFTGKCKTFHQQKTMDAVIFSPVCVVLKTVKSVQFVGCLCDSHTLAQISYGVSTSCLLFKSIFLLRFRAGIDVKLCKLLPQFIEKFTSIKAEYFCIFLNNLSPVFFTVLKIVLKLWWN